MNMNIDLTKVYQQYKGLWIALDENLIISEASVEYILNHFNREISELHKVIQEINTYSMANKRKVTPELIKEVISFSKEPHQ